MRAVNLPPTTMPRLKKYSLSQAAWLLMLLVCMTPANAQASNDDASSTGACKADEVIRFRGGTARLENDRFTGTDQNYTNGVAFTAVSHDIVGKLKPECLPAPVRLQAKLITLVNPGFWADAEDPAHTQNVVVRFGQSMFTPKDFSRTDLIEDDRPYAGLLYVGMSWNRRHHEPQRNSEILDTREITLGVIGPLALAQPTQDLVHDVMGVDRFLGWQNQLKNEPALQLAMDRKFRDYRGTGAIQPGFAADSIRSLGLRLGNIETSATVGIEGRLGWNLPNDFGSYPIRPGAENRPPSAASIRGGADDVAFAVNRPRAGAHLFGTLETKLVLHDFSLDGNLFQSSHSVTRKPWVVQAAVGVSVQGRVAGHGVKLAVMRVYRTREYEEQGPRQAYGSVALSIEF
ncbi:MAG: lipid A deacylase LpxR family protein [Rhodoferax sp.]|uniref:lipid A deacylase LpxR family protein n=1 Tax=Rhodoferax sp. TaxID=50421 RepID=UPI0013FFCC13|nr:lipid A deacylase LpxR family protein [Rhodoferax sp.]NDP39985.1 lipid A deacylase LpxR family protein [Rhodoferax sp.]